MQNNDTSIKYLRPLGKEFCLFFRGDRFREIGESVIKNCQDLVDVHIRQIRRDDATNRLARERDSPSLYVPPFPLLNSLKKTEHFGRWTRVAATLMDEGEGVFETSLQQYAPRAQTFTDIRDLLIALFAREYHPLVTLVTVRFDD